MGRAACQAQAMGGFKQNAGVKPKEMPNKRKGVEESKKPSAGRDAVEFRGTFVHAEPQAGVTRPKGDHAGSHDDKAREHAEHDIST
jgi:hypothetical protein